MNINNNYKILVCEFEFLTDIHDEGLIFPKLYYNVSCELRKYSLYKKFINMKKLEKKNAYDEDKIKLTKYYIIVCKNIEEIYNYEKKNLHKNNNRCYNFLSEWYGIN
jgi:hypothetical protein